MQKNIHQKLNLLKAFNGKAFVKSDDLEIKFNEIEIDKENSNFKSVALQVLK